MTAKKIILNIHLWLGLASGLVVVILGITGCLLAFETEIRSITEPQQYAEVENKPYLPPSVLKAEAEKYLDGKKINGIEYPGKGKAAIASYYDAENYKLVAINPYSGKILKVKNMNRDFFRIVLNGHYYLWLPEKIGQPIVASSTLIFLIMLITGLVLWWPKNKAARKQRFSIKWNAKWRRVNYDLHNVLGFYMTWIAIFITITGLVFGFEWFARSFYWVTSGGNAFVEEVHPVSDTLLAKNKTGNVADQVWLTMSAQKKEKEGIGLYYPLTNTDSAGGDDQSPPRYLL
ncbi:MAG: PepSY-associated TM helix domain-containing protein [Bacteroidota bacterium]